MLYRGLMSPLVDPLPLPCLPACLLDTPTLLVIKLAELHLSLASFQLT